MMIDLSIFLTLADTPLNPATPKPTSLEGNQMEASCTLFTSPDGRVEIGIWECTPGRFTADRSASSEFCHFISGKIRMRHEDGREEDLGPGDALMLPLGWKGEWVLLETTRKLYVITSG